MYRYLAQELRVDSFNTSARTTRVYAMEKNIYANCTNVESHVPTSDPTTIIANILRYTYGHAT